VIPATDLLNLPITFEICLALALALRGVIFLIILNSLLSIFIIVTAITGSIELNSVLILLNDVIVLNTLLHLDILLFKILGN
jgi:hypothetical protein